MDKMKTLNQHWDQIFQKTNEHKLGWFENDFDQTQKFLDIIPNWKQSTIFVPGVGTSGLADLLIKTNARLIFNDLSIEAIEILRKRYSRTGHGVHWICQDISEELALDPNSVDIWLDRAVLHFLTDIRNINSYFANVKKVIKPGGHVIFAEFSKSGANRCAGLDVKRYDIQAFTKFLSGFRLIVEEQYNYKNPSGDFKPYIYALFQRVD